jgi:hypothetical protein
MWRGLFPNPSLSLTMITSGIRLLIMNISLFAARKFHEHGHIFKEYPLNVEILTNKIKGVEG